jgi:hypothetical protein
MTKPNMSNDTALSLEQNNACIHALDLIIYDCHRNAVLHGFHDDGFNFGEKIALIHSELSEALESYRKHGTAEPDHHCAPFTNVEVELADAIIRIFDLAGRLNLKLGSALMAKHAYNKTRPYKHGKTF